MTEAASAARPSSLAAEAESRLESRTGSVGSQPNFDFTQSTVSDVRAAGKQAQTAATLPLELHDPGAGAYPSGGNSETAAGKISRDSASKESKVTDLSNVSKSSMSNHGEKTNVKGTASGDISDRDVSSKSTEKSFNDAGKASEGSRASDGGKASEPANRPDASKASDGSKASQAPESEQASKTAAELQKQMEGVRGQFGQAQTAAEKDAALRKLQDIVGAADKNGTDVQSALTKAADRFSPGSAAATKDLDNASRKVVDEINKLDPATREKLGGNLQKWGEADSKGKTQIEQDLRGKGYGPLADAMGGVDKVQHDHAGVFAKGKQVEEQVVSRFAKGMQDAAAARIDSRTDLQTGLLLAGRTAEAARVGQEIAALKAEINHTIPIAE